MRLSATIMLALIAAGPLDGHAQAATRTASEESVKAAYLYKFPSYVEWPAGRFEQAGSPITIGVLGADWLADELAAITIGRTVNDRPIRVLRVADEDSLAGVDVLFIPADARSRAGQIAAAAQAQSILTVTDWEDGATEGSVINFRTINGRVRFEVHLAQAERSGLRLSSGLLRVAERVHRVRR